MTMNSPPADAGLSPGRLLRAIAARYRSRLALTYGLTGVENIAELLYPSAIGLAIDGLLSGRPHGLVPLIALWFAHLVVGLCRHVYDTRLFTRIYAHLVGDMVERQRGTGVDDSHVAARVALSREVVSFFEADAPAMATHLIRILGAAAMLAYYDWVVGAFALAMLVPVIWINKRFAARAYRLNSALNNRLEREIGIVVHAPLRVVRRHFEKVRFWRVRISDAEARTWGAVDLVMMAFTFSVLLRIGHGGATVGSIYAVLSYVWMLYEAVSQLPMIVQSVSRVRDIGERIAHAPGGE
ncbi:ABC transporter six-transmembrane domain-containing protein [Burkholderia sp. FERM BP-3421]|uniref:ABC transporter six-transmembrane domain-containing protein n=1 Tax=Burkholderia sp. FERM BP-3421 TaxID=1494466 RepID=UPI0023615666|nr:ABC transporter six-transmembrane domain-containing protein [Burkholderia sp. FERM BP-3421]WDD92729.1 ABC transporter six-transmembrane domain-containing protein [Burkholderia sp. FERM BP-3421]